jgi:hypothetical protein
MSTKPGQVHVVGEAMVSGGVTNWLVHVPAQPIPDEARNLLRDGTELQVPRVLYLNAKREALFENYRLAIVEAETAFEALVDQAVAQYYRNRGRSKMEVEHLFDETPFKNLIQHHIPRTSV